METLDFLKDFDAKLQQLIKIQEEFEKQRKNYFDVPVVRKTSLKKPAAKTYNDVEKSSLESFKSRHLVKSGRCKISSMAREKIRKARRGIPATEEYDTRGRSAFRKCTEDCFLYKCIGREAKSRFRDIWKDGKFGRGARQNTIVLEVEPPLLADIRKNGNNLIIEYSLDRRGRSIDSIAIKNRDQMYCHLERY